MQLMEEAGCWIKRGAHVSIKPPGGERYIRLDSLGEEYSEAKLRQALDGHHAHIPKTPRSEYTYSQVKRLIDVEAKLREGKGKGYMIWAERNNIDAKAQSIIFLKEHNIGSIDELEDQIDVLRSERNELHAAIREKKNRMKEINQLRQAIRDYRRTKDIYAQYPRVTRTGIAVKTRKNRNNGAINPHPHTALRIFLECANPFVRSAIAKFTRFRLNFSLIHVYYTQYICTQKY